MTALNETGASWSHAAHPDQAVRGIRFSANGDWVLTTASDGSVRRWARHPDGVLQYQWNGPIAEALVEADGTVVVDDGESTVRRTVPHGELAAVQPARAARLESRRATAAGDLWIEGHGDGRLVATDPSGEVRWARQPHHSPIRHVAASSDGRRLISIAIEGDVLLHDAATGHQLLAMEWPSALPIAAGFTDDDRTVVMVAMNGQVRVLPSTHRSDG